MSGSDYSSDDDGDSMNSLNRMLENGILKPSAERDRVCDTRSMLDEWIFVNSRIDFSGTPAPAPAPRAPLPLPASYSRLATSSSRPSASVPVAPAVPNGMVPHTPTMTINVNYNVGGIMQVDVSEDDVVYQLKQKLVAPTGLKEACQSIVMSGRRLDDDKTLGFYGVQPNSNLLLVAKLDSSGTTSSVTVIDETGTHHQINVGANSTTQDVMNAYNRATHTSRGTQQQLIYGGQTVQSGQTLGAMNVGSSSVLRIQTIVDPNKRSKLTIARSLFNPAYNFEFPSSDSVTYIRGRRDYFRPVGHKRLALDISRLSEGAEGGEDWLASDGRAGEWAVAYHGTCPILGAGIQEYGLSLRDVSFYDHGYYASPHVEIAEKHSLPFEDPKTGAKYSLIIQSRVHPDHIVEVLENGVDTGNYWFIEECANIRSYGLVIKPIRE